MLLPCLLGLNAVGNSEAHLNFLFIENLIFLPEFLKTFCFILWTQQLNQDIFSINQFVLVFTRMYYTLSLINLFLPLLRHFFPLCIWLFPICCILCFKDIGYSLSIIFLILYLFLFIRWDFLKAFPCATNSILSHVYSILHELTYLLII